MKECCETCSRKLELKKYDYSQGGCIHTDYDGFCCIAFGSEGIAVHMVGIDANSGICEMYSPKKEKV